ncbi:MAG: hypothetical protein CVV31_03000 [Methanomicrobiales archaeon HGW-Methanomicrobiales-2]|nr:MAG: hypothetical protein CVV31_03000 [Methanomicrobiales archaeon HGW-Methanomicrobiales-2]
MGNPSKRIPVMTLCLIAATLLLVGTASAAAPQAAFSSSTTSGAEPLTVQFTDTSTGGDPDGWAWFFGDETYGDAWTNQTAASGVAPGWEARGGHTSVAMPDGSIVLMGGHDDGYNRLNDTWLSRDGGTTWTVVNTSPGWSGRDGHAAVAVGDSIVLMGGNDGALKNDVWRSDDYGATWENITPQDPDDIWPARRDHTSVTMPDGSIVTMGGSGAVWRENDVWRSDDYGATWTRQTANAEWTARYAHSSVVVGDSIVLMCGYDGSANQNDVWRSDDYGATWVEVTPDDWWPERQHPTSVAMPDGSIILMGGYNTGAMNDVRRSDDGGWTWMQLPNAGWSARSSHSSVAMPDGSIVIMGGFGGAQTNTARNDTWRLQPAGSNEQNPSHTYNTPGTYAVTLQAYNDDGYNATRQIGYITVTAQVAPTAAFTANRTTGAAPLAVQFTDTSAGGPTSWTWDFGDGETSTEQSPAHTYATAGTYTVSLNATNAAGSNTHTEAGYITVSAAPVLPVANFSADPTSGTAPLTVTFTDTSTGSPTGWAWFFGDEASGGAWTQVTDGAGWSARYSHTGVAMSDGSIVIMGGIDGSNNRLNDTWRSIDGGASWTRMNASSGGTERLSPAAVARPDGSIILMGGADANTPPNDNGRGRLMAAGTGHA